MKIDRFNLKNGISCVGVDLKNAPSFTVLILVRAGSRYENSKNNGVAHFFEHMVFKGSKKYPTAKDITFHIEKWGAEVNAYTAKDHTGYFIRVQAEHLDKVVDVLSDAFLNPILREDDIEKEKGVIKEEIQMYNDIPQSKIFKEFYKKVFNSPLRLPIAGEIQTVESIDRSVILDYLNTLYTNKRINIVFAGDLSRFNIRTIAERYFSSLKRKDKKVVFKEEEDMSLGVGKEVILKDKVNQAHLIIGLKSFSFYDNKKEVLDVAASILGFGMASWLFQELREKRGWAYYLDAGNHFYEDTGLFYIKAGVVDNPDVIKRSISLSLDLLERLKKRISEQDLQRAKEYLKGVFILNLEDTFNLAKFVGTRHLFFNKIFYPQEILKRIDRVRKEDVYDIASSILDPERVSVGVITSHEIKNII